MATPRPDHQSQLADHARAASRLTEPERGPARHRGHSPLERPIGRAGPGASGHRSHYIDVAAPDPIRLPCTSSSNTAPFETTSPGPQVGGRARATVPRRDGGSPTGNGWTIRSLEGRFADLPKVEAR